MISGFFNGQSVTAEDFATAFAGIMTNGVLADTQDALKVVPAGNMSVAINTGYCWIEGHFGNNEATTSFTISNSDGTLNRIDKLIARLNRTLNLVQLLVLKGTLSATPTPPALVRDGTYYDLCLAEIKVDKGTTTILEAMIKDTRNDSNLCGAVTLRSAFNFALDGKADKSVVEALSANKANISDVANGAITVNANKLQGKSISTTAPTENQILKYINGSWKPQISIVAGNANKNNSTSSLVIYWTCKPSTIIVIRKDFTKTFIGIGKDSTFYLWNDTSCLMNDDGYVGDYIYIALY